jgi:hypothetical protein
MSEACARFFVQEACMYECDPHAGQYRRYTDDEAAAFAAFAAVEGNPGDPYGAYTVDDAVYAGTFDHAGTTYNKTVFFGNGVYGPNTWQMYKMPIKASYCDAMHTACSNDYFCGTGDFWECSANYRAEEATRLAAAEAAALSDALAPFSDRIKAEVLNITGVTSGTAAQMAQDLADAEALRQADAIAAAQAVDDAENKLPDWAVVLVIALVVLVVLVASFVAYVVSMERTGKPLFVSMTASTDKPQATSHA